MNSLLVIRSDKVEVVWAFNDQKAGLVQDLCAAGAADRGDCVIGSFRECGQGIHSAFFGAVLHRAR